MPEPADNTRPIRLATHECEELNDWSALVGFQTDYHQQGAGPFEAWFDMSVGDDLRVVDQYCNREMTITGVPPDGYIAICITQSNGPRGILQGKELDENEVAILRPAFEATYRTPHNLRLKTILVPEARLRGALRVTADAELEHVLPGTRLVTLPGRVVTRLTWLAEHVLAAPREAASGAADAGIWLGEIEDHFLTALTTALTRKHKSAKRAHTRERHVKYVAALRDYIEAHLNAPIGLETLARETGVSPRTLEYAFRDIFDTTPLRYVKTRRLTAVRRRLLEAADPALNVTDIAFRYGFAHLSYFARDYRALFGESPSETLRSRTVGVSKS